MTTIVGLTGGIASGKTTILNFLKKKKIPVHDSDSVVSSIYYRPKLKFINYLKNSNFENFLDSGIINKKIIRKIIFENPKQKQLLERYIHREVKKSRDRFLKMNAKTKVVFLDIPLLFENKLDKICDYTILLYSPQKIRKNRAIRRKGMNKKILGKIIKSQLSDTIKRRKADFIINTSTTKQQSYKQTIRAINTIMNNEK